MTPPMIGADWVRMMAGYNTEMNRRIYVAAGRLPDAERKRDRGAFFGSIHATLNHLVWGDRAWLDRFCGRTASGTLRGGLSQYDDFAALAAARAGIDADLEAWAQNFDPAWLDGEIGWHSAATGRDVSRPRAVLVVHLFNHQTHHRGQVHAMLTAAGETTGDTDLWVVVEPAR